MNHPLRPKLQQIGVGVLLLTTAVASGILLGWLLSGGLMDRMVESRRSPRVQASARPRPDRPPATTPTAQFAIANVPTLAAPSVRATTDPPALTPSTAATNEPANVLFQRIVAAETGLRSGEVEAVIDYGNGSRSSAEVRFDLGTAQIPPRLDFKTVYQGSSDAQTLQEITIGDRAWERRGEASWTVVPARKGMWDQIRFFLPGAEYGSNPSYSQQQDHATLSWYDATRDADVQLIVDPETALPLLLKRQTRSTGLTLTVTYQGWNTPVAILPPGEDPH